MDSFERRGRAASEPLQDGAAPGRWSAPYDAAATSMRGASVRTPPAPPAGEVARWAAKARAADRDALKKLFAVYKDRVYRTALLLLCSSEAAEAVTEEVFVSYVHESPAEGTHFETWVYRATVKLCVRHMTSDEAATFDRLAVDTPHRGTAIRRRIAGALGTLPVKARVAFVLREGQGFGYDEIAGLMDEESARIPCHLAAARDRLSDVLGEIEFEGWNVG